MQALQIGFGLFAVVAALVSFAMLVKSRHSMSAKIFARVVGLNAFSLIVGSAVAALGVAQLAGS